MSLKVTYWLSSKLSKATAGAPISTEPVALSGSSAQSGVTPQNAVHVSIYATETAAFQYDSANPTAAAATSTFIGAGERIWLDAVPGNKVAGIQAT